MDRSAALVLAGHLVEAATNLDQASEASSSLLDQTEGAEIRTTIAPVYKAIFDCLDFIALQFPDLNPFPAPLVSYAANDSEVGRDGGGNG